jgi:hypothetical protein
MEERGLAAALLAAYRESVKSRWTERMGIRLGQRGAAFVALLLVACSETRNGPTPLEMCRVLSEVCGTETDAIIQCAGVGQAGLKDPSAESRCYAVYDDCLPICQFPAVADAAVATADAGPSGEPSGEPSTNESSAEAPADSAAVSSSTQPSSSESSAVAEPSAASSSLEPAADAG